MKHFLKIPTHLLLIKSMLWIQFFPRAGGHPHSKGGVDDVHVVAVGPVGAGPRPLVLVVVPHPGGDL